MTLNIVLEYESARSLNKVTICGELTFSKLHFNVLDVRLKTHETSKAFTTAKKNHPVYLFSYPFISMKKLLCIKLTENVDYSR